MTPIKSPEDHVEDYKRFLGKDWDKIVAPGELEKIEAMLLQMHKETVRYMKDKVEITINSYQAGKEMLQAVDSLMGEFQ